MGEPVLCTLSEPLLLCASALILFVVLSPLHVHVPTARRKLGLCLYGAAYMALSRDGQFQLPPDPGKSCAAASAKKRVVFVRHGESAWNECFNRPADASLPLRLLRALARELGLLLCMDSVFIDSPLSDEGLEQARLLEAFLVGEQGEELRRLCEAAAFAASPLRRAAATGLLAFGRFLSGGKPLWALSCLQEISRNVDTLALAAPFCPPAPLPAEAAAAAASAAGAGAAGAAVLWGAPSGSLQGAYNLGNKALTSHGGERLEAFCDWVFSPCSPAALQPTVVVTGHSLWFRTFFQVYLPHTAYHECKHAKIVNCGVVMFDLEQLSTPGGGRAEYRIAPDSVSAVHGGFEQRRAARWGRAAKRD